MLHRTSQNAQADAPYILHDSLMCRGKQPGPQNPVPCISFQGQICTCWQCMHHSWSVRPVLSVASNSSCVVCSAGQLCAYLIKQQPERPFRLSSKLAQTVGPLAGKQRDWCAAAVPAGASQGSGHQSLATSWSPMKQNAPAHVAHINLVIATSRSPVNQNAAAYVAHVKLTIKLKLLGIRFMMSDYTLQFAGVCRKEGSLLALQLMGQHLCLNCFHCQSNRVNHDTQAPT
jgi:hypothetical protein